MNDLYKKYLDKEKAEEKIQALITAIQDSIAVHNSLYPEARVTIGDIVSRLITKELK